MQDKPRAYRMLYVVYAVLGLITVRKPHNGDLYTLVAQHN